MDKLIEIKKLVKNYTTKTETLRILKGINLELGYGETVSITGESGSGKSTLLNMIGGLDNATDGKVMIEGTDITGLDEDEMTVFRNKKIGFVFQSHYLLEEFTSIENVMIPYMISDFNREKAYDKARRLLSAMGMEKRIDHYPSQLSGGEKQRVAIARAFINDPVLVLADEPTGNLDEKNAMKVLELLFRITSREKRSLVLVTHSSGIVRMTKKNYHLAGGKLNLIKKR
jgi:lipoprotein-releasing system ATP-binding protein